MTSASKKDSPDYQTYDMHNYTPLFIALATTKDHPQDTFIFSNNLNSIYLIHNYIHHPSSQHNHPHKILNSTIVHQILWTKHNITLPNDKANFGISSNKIIDELAIKGSIRNEHVPTPHIHTTHTIPYWLNRIPIGEHQEEINNLQIHINKCHCQKEL